MPLSLCVGGPVVISPRCALLWRFAVVATTVPPYFPNTNRTVLETATANTAVGDPLVALVNATDVAINYRALDYSNGSHLFKVGLCDGVIRVNLSNSLQFVYPYTFYVLSVAAQPNGDEISETVANITIVVQWVNKPPYFNGSASLSVFENQTTGVDNTFGAPIDGALRIYVRVWMCSVGRHPGMWVWVYASPRLRIFVSPTVHRVSVTVHCGAVWALFTRLCMCVPCITTWVAPGCWLVCTAEDPDYGQTASLTLTTVAGTTGYGYFGVDNTTRRFYVLPNAVLNYYVVSAYDVDVQVGDARPGW